MKGYRKLGFRAEVFSQAARCVLAFGKHVDGVHGYPGIRRGERKL